MPLLIKDLLAANHEHNRIIFCQNLYQQKNCDKEIDNMCAHSNTHVSSVTRPTFFIYKNALELCLHFLKTIKVKIKASKEFFFF